MSYSDFKKAAGTTIVVGDEILLAKRCESWEGKSVPLGGYWSIFAGEVEENENTLVCAIRELMEESSIEIDITQLEYVNELLHDEKVLVVYLTQLKEKPNIVLNDEHTDYMWFPIEKIKEFPYNIQDDLVESISIFNKKRYKPK
jgi:8-oxo-dGTP pyrophosphatase MutT (NUDIX family)